MSQIVREMPQIVPNVANMSDALHRQVSFVSRDGTILSNK